MIVKNKNLVYNTKKLNYMTLLKNIYTKISKIINNDISFLALIVFDYFFVIINIYRRILLIGLLFLAVNLLFLIFLTKKKSIGLIFLLYPLSRVLKISLIPTSLLTILMAAFFGILLIKKLINKEKFLTSDIAVIVLFSIYVLFTLVVSLMNIYGFEFTRLISYYLYLAFPIVCFICIKSPNEVDMNKSIILLCLSYLFGMLVTIAFYKVIPGGAQKLASSGVNVFNMGVAGIRYSPLTDDPNYGSALFILLSTLFIVSKKTMKESIVGYSIIGVASILSIFSISKMFILCFVITVIFLLLKIILKIKNTFITIAIVISFCMAMIIFLSTSVGSSLLIRTFGNKDGITLDRITSGRASIFGEYSSYILSNPLVLLFGKGPIFHDLTIFSTGEHNTFTINIFGSGIIGVTIFFILLFIMLKNRFDKQCFIPKNIMFWPFMICVIVCFMSLGISPSTVFPIFVVGAQYINFENIRKGYEINI